MPSTPTAATPWAGPRPSPAWNRSAALSSSGGASPPSPGTTSSRGPDLDARHRARTAARILLEIGDASRFKSSGHLAAYASIAPVTHLSGCSIKGEHPARTGNRKLKRAFFLAAFAALSDPTSRADYQRKRNEGKKHNAALICLADDAATSCSPCSATGPTTGTP